MMKKNVFYSLFLILSLFASVQLVASELSPFLFSQGDKSQLFVNNRVLALVEGEPITVLDLVKRLDMAFLREFSQYASSSHARFQFYQVNWKSLLDDMIRQQLIKADAKESKVEVNHGEVRQQMEKLFGPNILENLGKVNLSLTEAEKIIQEELLLERMIAARVHSKVFRSVTPSEIWLAYQEFVKDPQNQQVPMWEFRVITMQDQEPHRSYEVAEKACLALQREEVEIDSLEKFLKESGVMPATTQLHITPLLQQKEESLSPQFKVTLLGMEKEGYSKVVEQQSRSNQSIVHRIFFLQKYQKGGTPSFEEKEQDIRYALLEKEYVKYSSEYYAHLSSFFDVQKPYLEDESFQPFLLF